MPNIMEMEKLTKIVKVDSSKSKDEVFKSASEKISILINNQ